ncbi:MAG: oligosaccharide flippase family protein [Pseudomonadota bacterium]
MSAVRARVQGDGIGARVMRGSALTFFGFGASQALRLGSNLILTRLLFPEAFGLMAIISLFLTGLQMISDVGLVTCVVRSKRGNDPAFLNTTWTIQIIRGVVLGAICLAIAGPVARFYDEAILQELMYGLAFAVLIMGLQSTRIATASRNITLGRVTWLDMGTQAVSTVIMVALAVMWESVWALMVGLIVQHALKSLLSHVVLPGHANRLQLEREALREQFHFGKYLFISSSTSFLIENGDRIILSKFLSLASLGFYNIAYFFGSVPLVLMGSFAMRVIYPLYSARPPLESADNRRTLSRTRFALTGGMFAIMFGLALLGQWLVDLLYTPEYSDVGVLLVGISLSLMPSLIIRTHAFAILASGKSSVFTAFQLFRGVLQTGLLLLAVINFGVLGALVAQPLAALLSYPVLYHILRPYRAQDPLHDAVFFGLTALCAMIVFWTNGDVFWQLAEMS